MTLRGQLMHGAASHSRQPARGPVARMHTK